MLRDFSKFKSVKFIDEDINSEKELIKFLKKKEYIVHSKKKIIKGIL